VSKIGSAMNPKPRTCLPTGPLRFMRHSTSLDWDLSHFQVPERDADTI